MNEEAILELQKVSHAFGPLLALDDVSLTIAPSELVCLVGPSGCGKTTLLRVAAGLEELQQGGIAIDGRTVADRGAHMPPEERGVGLVFQDYALFPHLSVLDNVGFGLRGQPAAQRRMRSLEILEQLGVAGLARNFPHTLSGGQQQRVALARALAPKPRLMLLDEPFSDLDARLRERVRDETLHLLKKAAAASLIVTHDPDEAMFMAERIAVMRAGRIVQLGRPAEIYLHPVNAFVASLFSEVNRIDGVVSGGGVETPFGILDAKHLADGTEVQVLIRPEALKLAWAGEGEADLNVGRVVTARMLGRSTLIHLHLGHFNGRPLHLHSRVPGHVAFAEGDDVTVGLDISQAFVFPRDDPT